MLFCVAFEGEICKKGIVLFGFLLKCMLIFIVFGVKTIDKNEIIK